jgi:hypothetical protein
MRRWQHPSTAEQFEQEMSRAFNEVDRVVVQQGYSTSGGEFRFCYPVGEEKSPEGIAALRSTLTAFHGETNGYENIGAKVWLSLYSGNQRVSTIAVEIERMLLLLGPKPTFPSVHDFDTATQRKIGDWLAAHGAPFLVEAFRSHQPPVPNFISRMEQWQTELLPESVRRDAAQRHHHIRRDAAQRHHHIPRTVRRAMVIVKQRWIEATRFSTIS